MASVQEANAKTTDQYSQASRPSATEKEKGVQQQQTAGESKDAQNFNPFRVQEEAKEAAKEAFVAQQEAQEVMKRAYTKQLEAQDKARGAAEQLFAQQEGGKQAAALAARQAAATAVEEQKSAAQKQMDQAVITAQVLGAQIAEQTVASNQNSANARFNPRGNVPPPSSVPSFQQPGALTVEQQEMFGLANQMDSAAVSQMGLRVKQMWLKLKWFKLNRPLKQHRHLRPRYRLSLALDNPLNNLIKQINMFLEKRNDNQLSLCKWNE